MVFQMDAMSTIRRLSTIKAAPAEQPMDEGSLFVTVTYQHISPDLDLPLCLSRLNAKTLALGRSAWPQSGEDGQRLFNNNFRARHLGILLLSITCVIGEQYKQTTSLGNPSQA